jgi:NADPH:quinone reductase
MLAVVIREPGGPDVLELREVPDPEPGPEDILVRVRAAGVNRADLLQRRGGYPAPAGWPQAVPGLEYAGDVAAVGARVTRWREGDRVMGLVGGGGCAELLRVHEREALPMLPPLGYAEAAAVPEAFTTAHDALATRLRLAAGERLLIHAVASGVGTAALQLAAAMGATVIGTSRSAWKLSRCEALGLRHAVDASASAWPAAVRQLADGGVDAVLDLVGGDYLAGDLDVLRELGRIALVGLVAGRTAGLDLGMLLRKRATVIGTTLRYRPLEEKALAARAVEREVLPLIAEGRVRPVLDRVLDWDRVAEAHRLLEDGRVVGKVVLTIGGGP